MVATRPSLTNSLAKLLHDRGWSEKTFAAKIGLSRSRLNRVKNGYAVPSVAEALSIASALNLRVADIFSLRPRACRPNSELSR